MSEPLVMWTVYDHPLDDPGHFVAREFQITPGHVHPTANVLRAAQLEDIRDQLSERGLIPMQPVPEDDPVIMEVWM